MAQHFTVFGLQKTGTKFLEKTLKDNFQKCTIVNTFSGGWIWKHAFHIDSPHVAAGKQHYTIDNYLKLNKINCIHVHRNPYMWMESILTHSMDLRRTYPTCFHDRPGDMLMGGYNLSELARLWNNHTKWWLDEAKKRNVYRIKFEDCVASTDHTATCVREMAFMFQSRLHDEKNINVRPIDPAKKKRYIRYELNSVKEQRYLDAINLHLDPFIMETVGYEIIKTEDWKPKEPLPIPELQVPVRDDIIPNVEGYKPDVIQIRQDTSIRECGHEGVKELVWRTKDVGAYGSESDGPLRDWLEGKDDFMAKVRKFDTVVQAGGNCGMYARFYKNYFSQVYSFEPNDLNFYCLDQNCKGSGFYLYYGALGDKSCKLSLGGGSQRNCGTYKITEKPGDIQMYRIDDLGLLDCDLIHLDLEGYEEKAIKGAMRTIERFKPVVITERARGLKYLQGHGYEVYKKCKADTVFWCPDAGPKVDERKKTKVLIVASGMSAKQFKDYPYKERGWIIVAVNNGWQVCEKQLDTWVKAVDYKDKEPKLSERTQKTIPRYRDWVRKYGGQKECGFSITLTAAYCALGIYKPDVIAFLGADMNYKPDVNGHTHIYGVGNDIRKNGISDPDRMVEKYGGKDKDYLKTIYKRFETVAAEEGCEVVNLSIDPDTRLPYKRSRPNLV